MKKLFALFGAGLLVGGIVLAAWAWSTGSRSMNTEQSPDQSPDQVGADSAFEDANGEARAYLEQNKKTAEIISRASENNDIVLCASVPVDAQDSCRVEIAIKARDVKQCPSTASPMKDLCEGVIYTASARDKKDITICTAIGNQNEQANCYRWFTQGECATIKDIQKQNLCIASFETQEEG